MAFRILSAELNKCFTKFFPIVSISLPLNFTALSITCKPPAVYEIPDRSYSELYNHIHCDLIEADCSATSAQKTIRVSRFHAEPTEHSVFDKRLPVCQRNPSDGKCVKRGKEPLLRDMKGVLASACLANIPVPCADRAATWVLQSGTTVNIGYIGCVLSEGRGKTPRGEGHPDDLGEEMRERSEKPRAKHP